ncbi:MAG TPA: enoyl-CoA hydratase/isomerase [Rhizomicrobium sp.]|jgi:2-(1,2-epoxy-1,2-dihydrophenyl)acetyl-CoA isomerase
MRKDFERVHVTTRGRVAIVALNHPEAMNALSPAMAKGLMEALAFVSTRGFRALVLTGQGPAFCSGANLAEAAQEASWPPDAGRYLDEHYHPLLFRLRDLEIPFLTAVNGAAAGIGMSLAMMGDLILAARSAFFVQAFAKVGLVPDGGATWLLPRLVGLARARELSLLGERMPAEKALEWGLINRLCADETLLNEAITLAEKLAEGPASALSATRRLYWESPQNGFEAQLACEREAQCRAGQTDDLREGVRAFLEKRPPCFRD